MGKPSSADPSPKDAPRERCVTGIEGLDHILGGGIPKGNMVLLAGPVGTGKTTLSLEFLVHGAERGEASLFLSVTEASSKLIENLGSFDFFRKDLIKSNKLVFVDLPIMYERLGLDHEELTVEEIELLTRSVLDLVESVGAERVVLDSLTSLGYRIRRDERIRDFMLTLGQGLSRLGTTAVLVSEVAPMEGRYSSHGVEEAVVDGIILLGNASRQGDILRVLQVVKMRGTSHSRSQYVMELTPLGMLMAPHLKGNRAQGG